MRGGTSRGIYFDASDLPSEVSSRDRVLLSVIGGPDSLQVDGIGGGHPLTNKVAIVSKSERDDADVDYLFLQVNPEEASVSDGQNCGNILSGVGPFAIESGMMATTAGKTIVRVYMVNTSSLSTLTVQTPDGNVSYEGDVALDGVPGSAAAIVCEFSDVAGSATGEMLPTGNHCDAIDGIDVTMIDNGMPVCLIRAADLGIGGYEAPDELEAIASLGSRLERLRLAAGHLMGLGDVGSKTIPKMCLVSAPQQGGSICTRTFIPHACHRSVGVLGAISIATACLLPGSVASTVARIEGGSQVDVGIEHPSGTMTARLVLANSGRELEIERACAYACSLRSLRATVRLVPQLTGPCIEYDRTPGAEHPYTGIQSASKLL